MKHDIEIRDDSNVQKAGGKGDRYSHLLTPHTSKLSTTHTHAHFFARPDSLPHSSLSHCL